MEDADVMGQKGKKSYLDTKGCGVGETRSALNYLHQAQSDLAKVYCVDPCARIDALNIVQLLSCSACREYISIKFTRCCWLNLSIY